VKITLLNHIGAQHDKEMSLIADACQQYSDIVCASRGIVSAQVAFTPGATDAPAGSIPLGAFKDPDTADALGYHATDDLGRAYGKAFYSLVPNGEMLHDKSGTGQSLAGVITHELAEILGDELANAWRYLGVTDPASGKIYNLAAEELCDWVQNFAFQLKAKDGTMVDCSDFVYPQFFNPEAKKGDRLSHMDTVTSPGEVAAGSYGIVANEVTPDQVFGRAVRAARSVLAKPVPKRIFHATEKPPAWREALQGHPAGRTTRRLG
jgi:hypothetical protein